MRQTVEQKTCHLLGKSFRRSLRYLPWLMAAGVSLATLSCGAGKEFNLFGLLSKPTIGKTKVAQTEEVRVLIDNKDYDGALALVQPMLESEKQDSNDARLLYAAAKLGQVKLDLWTLISSFLDTQSATSSTKSTSTSSGTSKNSSSSGGIDSFLDTLTSSVLGTTEETAAKTAALIQAIEVLRAAPYPLESAVVNTSCLFGAILAIPSFTTAKNAITATTSALETIKSTAVGDGGTCPDIGLLDTALSSAISATTQFAAVLAVAKDCPFLNTTDAATQLNSIEKQLAKLTSGADKGCSGVPTCPESFPTCQSLFPTCVQQTLSLSGGVAGDGIISACELTRNCIVGGDCF
jgi:hypothetical protein